MSSAALAAVPAAYQTIQVDPITPTIGAEISGVDLANLSDRQFDEIKRAFLTHQVIFFRDQEIDYRDQKAFGERFGPLHVHPAAPHLPDEPAVFVIHTHKDSKINNGERWHSDVSCELEPPLATMLHMHILPPSGGDTMFASMYAAYEALSDKMQRFLSGLTGVHESEHIYRGRYADRGVNDAGRVYPSAEHPVIRTHPDTGRPALYVNELFTVRIKDMKPRESRALLDFLAKHVEDPIFSVRFRWSRHAVAFWDNRCAQHLALWDYWPHERKGYRVTVKGDRPFYRP
ncbi:MAG: TauD/TfdA dioxygenase family protein [Alphaproteobacteria bacterium]